ncbi:MAG TPA: alpha/beta hydrolase [Planctomycetaceae bacterium]|nr:alpha/beta hydrolase [Planctomycetaceae bacterium]
MKKLSLRKTKIIALCHFTIYSTVCCIAGTLFAQHDVPANLTGEKSLWHGFDRYDFAMNAETLAISPSKAPENAGNGMGEPDPGSFRCILVVPKTFAEGNPWSWRGCYWDHEPQTEVELLKRGFCIAYINADPRRNLNAWDAWYKFLAEECGLAKKSAFQGMSRGGENSYTYGTTFPERVACIYADNPGSNPQMFEGIYRLAAHDVPLLHVNGSIDPLMPRVSDVIENAYTSVGGRISVIIKDGPGHHPHNLQHPAFIADFIEKSFNENPRELPAWCSHRVSYRPTGSDGPLYFYSLENKYRRLESEPRWWVTVRGAEFVPVYDRYEFRLRGAGGSVTVIAPQKAAEGTPWVLRVDEPTRDDKVTLALLEKGFHIVTGPVAFNGDATNREQWQGVYNHFMENGFSRKVVLMSSGGAATQNYAWAINHPDKTACVYAENPNLSGRSAMLDKPVMESLEALKDVSVLNVVGKDDPWYKERGKDLEKRFTDIGGKFTVLYEAKGHLPLSPNDPNKVVEFILDATIGRDGIVMPVTP